MGANRVDLKIVLLGMENVGKTAIVERFLHERFTGSYQNTIGAAYGAKKMQSRDRDFVVGVWDTAGSERYEAMSRIYYRGAKAAIICYDVLQEISFKKIKFWVNELKNNEENCRIYICGCKKDLLIGTTQRGYPFGEIQDYVNGINSKLYETSSKTGEGIYELFQTIVDDVTLDSSFNPPPVHHTITLDSKNDTSPTSKFMSIHCGCK